MLASILDIATLAIILMIAIGLHEFSHAYVSYKLGDPTPKLQGRLTTNPLKHIDPIGFLMIFLIGFGWGKPVQVNPYYYKNPVKGELLVALAGPAMNLVLAIAGIFIMLLSAKLTGIGLDGIMTGNFGFGITFLMQFSMINITLAVFNMIPLPPLDGFRLVKIISLKFATFVEQYTRYIVIAFLIIVLIGKSPIGNFLSSTSYTIFKIIFTIFANIFY